MGSLDGYQTLLERRLPGDQSERGGPGTVAPWRVDPCSDFSEPAFAAPPLLDYLTTRSRGDEVTIGVHEDATGAGELLEILTDRVAECGRHTAPAHPLQGVWTATPVAGMGDEAVHLRTVYRGDVGGGDPSIEQTVVDRLVVRTTSVVLLVDSGYRGAGPGDIPSGLPDALQADTEAELAALTGHLGLDG